MWFTQILANDNERITWRVLYTLTRIWLVDNKAHKNDNRESVVTEMIYKHEISSWHLETQNSLLFRSCDLCSGAERKGKRFKVYIDKKLIVCKRRKKDNRHVLHYHELNWLQKIWRWNFTFCLHWLWRQVAWNWFGVSQVREIIFFNISFAVIVCSF